ncbi:MAG: nucleoside recognition domain-containing protein, partial [Bacilli bacterium]
PPLVGMLVGITIFKDSGALDMFVGMVKPVLVLFHIPTDIVPLAMLRPITGSGALAFTETLIKTNGPDSFIGRLASTMQGSTDTTLYILTVYFGSVGIRKAKYALKVGLLADLAGIIASIYICVLVFG